MYGQQGGPAPPGYGTPQGYAGGTPQGYAAGPAQPWSYPAGSQPGYGMQPGAQPTPQEEGFEQREFDRLVQNVRRGGQHQTENMFCARRLVFWGFLNAVLWAGPVKFMGDWWVSKWHANGISELKVQMGLNTMTVEMTCKGTSTHDASSTKLCTYMKPYVSHDDGNWDLGDLAAYMCDKDPSVCGRMGRMKTASWFIKIGCPAAGVVEILSSCLLFLYWHTSKPTKMLRDASNKLAAFGMCLGTFGLLGWTFYSPQMNDLVLLWATCEAGATGKSNAMDRNSGFKQPPFTGNAAGMALSVAGLAGLCTICRIAFTLNLPLHYDEPDESTRLVDEEADAKLAYSEAVEAFEQRERMQQG